MLKSRTPDFAEQVWIAASVVGRTAPKIVDHILAELFPVTCRAAEDEGALPMLRKGCIVEAKRVLRSAPPDEAQGDFEDIDEAFKPLVRVLHRPAYHVESLGEEVTVARLIAEPVLLDDARRFMRRKGEECIAEAERLDELFQAVSERLSS